MEFIADIAEAAGIGLLLTVPGLIVAGVVFVTLVSGAAARFAEVATEVGDAIAVRSGGRAEDCGEDAPATPLPSGSVLQRHLPA